MSTTFRRRGRESERGERGVTGLDLTQSDHLISCFFPPLPPSFLTLLTHLHHQLNITLFSSPTSPRMRSMSFAVPSFGSFRNDPKDEKGKRHAPSSFSSSSLPRCPPKKRDFPLFRQSCVSLLLYQTHPSSLSLLLPPSPPPLPTLSYLMYCSPKKTPPTTPQ